MDKVKKLLSVLLSALLLMSTALAFAEDAAQEAAEIETIVGRIVEVEDDGGYLIENLDDDNRQMRVIVSDATRYISSWTPGEGDVVLIEYDGTIAESDPPQVAAQVVLAHALYGQVLETDDSIDSMLVDTMEAGEVIVLLQYDDAKQYEGELVRVFFNGMMALSMPGRIGGLAAEPVKKITGTVKTITYTLTETGGGHFLVDSNVGEVEVYFDDQTKFIDNIVEGSAIQVFYNGIMTRSMPGQVYAMAVGLEQAAEAAE